MTYRRKVLLHQGQIKELDEVINAVNTLAEIDWSNLFDTLVTLRERIQPYGKNHKFYCGE